MIKKWINRQICVAVMLCIGQIGYSQSSSEGDVYVAGGLESVLHNVQHTFLLSTVASNAGKIVTQRSTPRGYFSFFGTSSWTGADNGKYVDGYVRTYLSSSFVFPIGDAKMYRPARISIASSTQPADAAYYASNPTAVMSSKAPNIRQVSTREYWDINGSLSASISLSWSSYSDIATLTGGDLSSLTIVGWNGSQWVEIPSIMDGTSIIGGSSTISNGSMTSMALTPNAYEYYTLGSKIIVNPPKDTSIVVTDTSTKVIGPAATSDPNVKYSVAGPYHGSGTATIDVNSGVLSFKPSTVPFLGFDTIYKIRCVTNGSFVVCDSIRIVIEGRSPKDRLPVGDSTNYNTPKVLVDLPPINTGGKPYTKTSTSSAGSTISIGLNGKINYTPKKDFYGTDTVRIIRCIDGICDTVTYWIVVKAPSELIVVNYISPNGDGVNDVWNIDNVLTMYPTARVMIYNRWGNMVWRSTGPYGKVASNVNVWFGQLEGSDKQVPDGVYYYLLELNDNFKTTKTGFIEVMRQ